MAPLQERMNGRTQERSGEDKDKTTSTPRSTARRTRHPYARPRPRLRTTRGPERTLDGVAAVLLRELRHLPAAAARARARRVVAGRLVNAYTDAEADYVLALISRVSIGAARSGTLGVAGLQPVAVAGVENVKIDGVEGHVAWRGLVGRCLAECAARGVRVEEAAEQEKIVGESIKRDIAEGQREAGVNEDVAEELEHEEK